MSYFCKQHIHIAQAQPAKWAHHVAAEPDNLAQLVDEQLQSTEDWENNFKALKVSIRIVIYQSHSQIACKQLDNL